MRRTLLVLASLLPACSGTRSISIDVTTGLETDGFTATPAVTRVEIDVASLDGTVSVSATAAPGGTFDLGNVKDDQQISVAVTGFAGDTAVMGGSSLSGLSLASAGDALPVFAQRVGAWARPTGGLASTHVGGTATVIGDRYLTLTGGSAAGGTGKAADDVDSYDLFALGGAKANAYPRVPETIVSLGQQVLLINASGATWIDYSSGTASDAVLPSGLASFAAVSGGRVMGGTNGRTFVVGPSRTSSPSASVLEIDDDQTLVAYTLATPRKAAAAAWVNGVGLAVAGGSSSGAGMEVLLDGSAAFEARSFPADATEGAGAVSSDGRMVLIGGRTASVAASTRRFDPACTSSCAAEPIDAATLPVALVNVAAYTLATGSARTIVVGDEPDGMRLTRSFAVDLGGTVTEVALREPRRGAVPMPAPNATLALLGGEHPDGSPALSVELFLPSVPAAP